jgi:hypothetical protein
MFKRLAPDAWQNNHGTRTLPVPKISDSAQSYCLLVWHRLKALAIELKSNIYQLKQGLLDT